MSDCVFCKIASHDLPAKIEYEDDEVCAFDDIAPKAPVHILIIPKQHISSINDLTESDNEIMGRLILTAQKLASKKGVAQTGYRLVLNTGKASGQIVEHIHLHLLGGQGLKNMVQ